MLGRQVHPGEVEEPDEAILRRPLALPRITPVVKAEVGAYAFFLVVEWRIAMFGTPVAVKSENLWGITIKRRKWE
jgi:hypothetical protein